MSAKTIRRREHGKGTRRRRLHLCSARMAPPRSKLPASPFPGFYFCRCNFIFENNHAAHAHIFFFFFFLATPPAHYTQKQQQWESKPPRLQRTAAIRHPSARYPTPWSGGAQSLGSPRRLHLPRSTSSKTRIKLPVYAKIISLKEKKKKKKK